MPKSPLLILHGALGSSAQFRKLSEKLEDRFELHFLDFSGHGNGKHTEEFSIEIFAEDLKTYLDQNKIAKIDVFGYSMGGYVSLKAISEGENRINKLLTLGTKFNWTPESAAHETKMLNPEKIEAKVPKFAEALDKRHQSLNWKDVLNKTSDMMIRMGNGERLENEDFAKINIPVKLMLADKDEMVSREETELIHSKIKNSEFEILPNSLHPIEKVDLEELSSKLLEYFNP